MMRCGPDGVPFAVQEIDVAPGSFAFAHYFVTWTDCRGWQHKRPLDWVLEHVVVTPRTHDQLVVCRNYARYVLETNVKRWWTNPA